jgi:hypothetical protein
MPTKSWWAASISSQFLLSYLIDAGGQRAISQLKILADLMNRLNSESSGDAKYRPCDVFDMAAGVGSGG